MTDLDVLLLCGLALATSTVVATAAHRLPRGQRALPWMWPAAGLLGACALGLAGVLLRMPGAVTTVLLTSGAALTVTAAGWRDALSRGRRLRMLPQRAMTARLIRVTTGVAAEESGGVAVRTPAVLVCHYGDAHRIVLNLN